MPAFQRAIVHMSQCFAVDETTQILDASLDSGDA